MDSDYDKLGITKVVSLPPYHLSTELTIKIMLSQTIKNCVIVYDSGFIEKLTAFEGMREYNSLTVLANLNAKVEVIETIEKTSFFPSPNCQSVVVGIDFDRKENSREFFLFLKELFRYKNKDLAKALKQSLPVLTKDKLISKTNFSELINSTDKVYALPVEELKNVYDTLK